MEPKEYFNIEKDFLKTIFENEKKFLSKTRIQGSLSLTPELLLTKNFILEYCYTRVYENNILYLISFFGIITSRVFEKYCKTSFNYFKIKKKLS